MFFKLLIFRGVNFSTTKKQGVTNGHFGGSATSTKRKLFGHGLLTKALISSCRYRPYNNCRIILLFFFVKLIVYNNFSPVKFIKKSFIIRHL